MRTITTCRRCGIPVTPTSSICPACHALAPHVRLGAPDQPQASVLAGHPRRRGDGRRPSALGRPLRAVMRDHPLDQAAQGRLKR